MKNVILFEAGCEDFVREALGLKPLKEGEAPKWGYLNDQSQVKELEGLADCLAYDVSKRIEE